MRTIYILAAIAVPMVAEVVFPLDVRLTAVATRKDGATYVVGQKAAQAYMARITDPNRPPVEIPIQTLQSESSYLSAIAIGDEGSIYVTGVTNVTVGVGQTLPFSFAQKYDASGLQQYSVNIGGEVSTSTSSIVVNAKGEALISGGIYQSGFVTTPGTPNAVKGGGFVIKLDVSGNVLVAAGGVGVGAAAYDAQDNIYVVGVSAIPPSVGAFQQQHEIRACTGNINFGFLCSYPQVIKLSADGKRVLYSTFLTGSWGAIPSAIAVTTNGEAIISGTTNSPDYPTTAGSLQAEYRASGGPTLGSPTPHPSIIPPSSSGYITKLNADGSGLIWSTYFSGTGAESVNSMKILSDGQIAIAGYSFSKDLPGMTSFPKGCVPLAGRGLPFVSTVSGDGAKLSSTLVPWELAVRGGPLVTENSDGSLGVISARHYVQYNPGIRTQAVCLADPADWTLLGKVAPGQLVTIFGFALDSATVDFNGSAARILYSSPDQLNIQVPLDVVPDKEYTVRVVSKTQTLEQSVLVVQRAPSVFLTRTPFGEIDPAVQCDGVFLSQGYEPLALNDDGRQNKCTTPANPGASISLFLNGLGAGQSPKLMLGDNAEGDLEFDPDSLLWRLRFRFLKTFQINSVGPRIDDVMLRFTPLIISIAR